VQDGYQMNVLQQMRAALAIKRQWNHPACPEGHDRATFNIGWGQLNP